MRDGLRVYDANTRVNPAAEVLERYVDASFRPRLADLAAYRVPAGRPADDESQLHGYRIEMKFYRRVLGEAGPHPTFTGRDGTWRGTQRPRSGVQDDQAENRVNDMDDEGTDVHLLVHGGWTDVVGLADAELEVGLIPAYHRYMADSCGRFPTEYLTSGRFFSSIERHEGEDMFDMVSQFLGDDVLMYASDDPHSECQFPSSVENVIRWSSLKPDTQRKLLWDNASRFYKQT